VATFLAFPHPLGSAVVDVGSGLAWLPPAALLLWVRGCSPRQAAWRAGVLGTLTHALLLHWIYLVTVRYGHAAPLVGFLAPLLLGAYVGCFVAAFGAGEAWLARRGAASPLGAALLWTLLEHLRSFALSGFPWATLGYAQHGNPVLLALAPWTGVYGLSFVTVLGSTSLLALVWPEPSAGRSRRAGALGVLAVAGLLAAAAWQQPPAPAGPLLRVAVLQGNVDQGVKWSPEWAERIVTRYERLTRRAVAQGAQVVVWPETAAPGSPGAGPELRRRLARLARETRTSLVVGAVGLDWLGSARSDAYRVYDSAFVIDADGRFTDRYDKSHLVPFGEYLPLRPLLGHFLTAIARGSVGRDVSPGRGPRPVALRLDGNDGAVTVGVPICYELLFPDLVRRMVGKGSQVLLAITNDAWYGRTGAPFQFLAITALRAAETGTWLARAANTGVSAFIDGHGQVREQTGIFEPGLRVRDLPLRAVGAPETFYVRYGDVFAWVCWAGWLALALHSRRVILRHRGEAS